MQVFYAPDISGKYAILPAEESRHCISVLRFSQSDTIHMIDGRGGFYTASIINPDSRACQVEVTSYHADFHKRNAGLHLAIAPTKQIDRFEWFLEKAVEIGIDEITPIRCQRSERKEIKTERLEKIIISSMKQAIVAKKPKLNAITPYARFVGSLIATEPVKFIAYCSDEHDILLKDILEKGKDVLLLIGPEGDFSQEEIQLAIASGFKPVSLGNNRLRTETAAVAGCAIFNSINA